MVAFFMEEPKIITKNPYNYNTVSLKKRYLPAPEQMRASPQYNMIGKFLGVEIHEWSKYYDKIFSLTEWAKEKSGLNETNDLMSWLGEQVNKTPSLSNKRIEDLYIFSKMEKA